MKTVELDIRGKVQGVCYRASTKEKAQQLNLVGWVKNQNDGSVKALVQGEQSAVDQLIEWAWQGPEYAKVKEVSVTHIEANNSDAENVVGFKVLYLG